MKLGTPIIVSEDVEFQQKMIDRIDKDWEVKYGSTNSLYNLERQLSNLESNVAYYAAPSDKESRKPRVDYTPKPLKLTQNISVMYEMK